MERSFAVKFGRGLLSTGSANLASITLGFLNILVAARFLQKDEFGVYILIQVIISFYSMVGDLGLNISTAKFVASAEDDSKYEIVSTILWLNIVIIFFLTITLLGARSFLASIFKTKLLSDLIVYIAMLVVLENLCAFFASALQGLQLFGKLACGQVVLSSLNFIFVICSLMVFGLGLKGLVGARILALAVCIVFYRWAVSKQIRFYFDIQTAKEMFQFGFPLWLNNVLTFIFKRIDVLLIGSLLNPTQVAYYGAASKIPESSQRMYDSYRTVYFPHLSDLFSHKRGAEAVRALNGSLRLVSLVGFFSALVVILFNKEIVRFLFTANYMSSAPVLSILIVASSIGCVSNLLGTTLVAAGYSKMPLLINMVDAGVNVASNLVLIPIFGIMGAAMSALLSRAITNPVIVIVLKRKAIAAQMSAYIKPILIFTSVYALASIFHFNGILTDILLLCLFLILCQLFSVLTLKDVVRLARDAMQQDPACAK